MSTLTAEVPTVAIDANRLRRLAEKADGLRDRPLKVITDGYGGVDVVEINEPGTPCLIDVVTPTEGPGVAGRGKITVHWHESSQVGRNGGSECSLDGADAVFVSQSAIEKLLLPYYMRFKNGAEVQQLQDLLFKNDKVLAAIHFPPSMWAAYPEVAALVLNEQNQAELKF